MVASPAGAQRPGDSVAVHTAESVVLATYIGREAGELRVQVGLTEQSYQIADILRFQRERQTPTTPWIFAGAVVGALISVGLDLASTDQYQGWFGHERQTANVVFSASVGGLLGSFVSAFVGRYWSDVELR